MMSSVAGSAARLGHARAASCVANEARGLARLPGVGDFWIRDEFWEGELLGLVGGERRAFFAI